MSIIGNMAGCYSPIGKTFIITDADGNEFTGVVVEQEQVFTATDNDVREGMVYASDNGVSTGTKDIPAYHTTEGKRLIPVGSSLTIPLTLRDHYDYTSLQCVVCLYNTSFTDSVAAEKVVVENAVYPIQSTVSEATITKDHDNKAIVFGITNDGDAPLLIRYFTYREEA